jgi:hypothetical protein
MVATRKSRSSRDRGTIFCQAGRRRFTQAGIPRTISLPVVIKAAGCRLTVQSNSIVAASLEMTAHFYVDGSTIDWPPADYVADAPIGAVGVTGRPC